MTKTLFLSGSNKHGKIETPRRSYASICICHSDIDMGLYSIINIIIAIIYFFQARNDNMIQVQYELQKLLLSAAIAQGNIPAFPSTLPQTTKDCEPR